MPIKRKLLQIIDIYYMYYLILPETLTNCYFCHLPVKCQLISYSTIFIIELYASLSILTEPEKNLVFLSVNGNNIH